MPLESTCVSLLCQYCGNTFRYRRPTVPQGAGKYCSDACRDRARQSRINCVCLTCGVAFTLRASRIDKGEGKYCSVACYRAIHPRIARNCEICGIDFTIPPNIAKIGGGKFCSYQCMGVSQRGEGGPRHPFPPSVRRRVWERDHGICHICQTLVAYNAEYHCGHIVDRSRGGSDKADNLVVMCAHCNLNKPRHGSREEYEAWRLSQLASC